MFKKTMVVSLSLVLFFGFTGMGFSAEKGNSRKGKYIYKKSCRSCHNDNGAAVSLSPNSKTQAQWERIFKKNKFEKFSCKEEWSKLPEKDLNDIFSYLHKYAFDSPTPAKCK